MESKITGSFSSWLMNRQSKPCHRQLLVLSGSSEWTQKTAELTIKQANVKNSLWVGDRKNLETVNVDRYKHFLGSEFNTLVYNAHSGVRANALMALSGTVSSEGLMILLCPNFETWPHFADPEAINRVSYGYSPTQRTSNFIHWLISCIQQDEFVTIVTEQQYFRSGKFPWVEDRSIKFEQQQQAVHAIQKTCCGRSNRPLVITADRGRGKTSALGIATATLFQQGIKKILITAPKFETVALAFEHCHALLADSDINGHSLVFKDASLEFCAPDHLLKRAPDNVIVLVDEAAAIPTDILKKICRQYSRVIFSTTIHGYEGSGRGFELRFKQFLNQYYPAWRNIHLSEPIRWYKGDVLEQFWFKTMLMQTQPPQLTDSGSTDLSTQYRKIEKRELLDSPALLTEIFNLLVNAHYQTTPDDINRMLDAEEQHIYAAFYNSHIIAVVLASYEGAERIIDIAKDISSGKRRVQGHLVAQSVLYQTGASEYAALRYLRIVRIAVIQEQQRKGVASSLLNYLEKDAISERVDFLCVSYGLDLSILNFWLKNDFLPTKLGTKKDASSGEHSLIMMRTLNEKCSITLKTFALEFNQELIYQCNRHFKELSSELISRLICLDATHQLTKQQYRKLQQLLHNHRHWDSCESSLMQLALSTTHLPSLDTEKAHALLVSLFIQNREQQLVQKELNLNGKKQLSQTIVEAVNRLISDKQKF